MSTPSFYGKQLQVNLTNESIAASDHLHQMAFDNSLQANILTTTAGDGKIIEVNTAACKLLGYSKEELLTQSRVTIFDINRTSFKKMLTQRTSKGHSTAVVTAVKKSGELLPCEVTSVVFMGEHGIEKAITTIVDISERILRQKKIDIKNEKIVAQNIVIANAKQKEIDTKNEKIVAKNIAVANSNHKYLNNIRQKIVANNIVLAESKQKIINILNEQIVADNIAIASTKQREIDTIKEQVVADNIVIAESKQKEIDIIKEQVVADNIIIANTKQKEIDIIKEQIVADNIVIAESKQKEIDIRKEKVVADNIVIANIKQKEIDIIKEQVVTDNIVIANTKQKEIDIIKEQIVTDNIVIAESKQKEIDVIKEQVVADNIILAQAKSDAMQVENNEWVKNLREKRETEKLDIATELHENINQLLCASRVYLTMAKGDVKNSEMLLTSASQYTLTAIEAIGKLTKRTDNGCY